MGGKGGIRGQGEWGKKEATKISMYNVGGGLCNTEKTSSDSIASYYADGQ